MATRRDNHRVLPGALQDSWRGSIETAEIINTALAVWLALNVILALGLGLWYVRNR